ncbi:Manganese transport protein MntH [Lactiplantibacillus plantarum]|nr:Manganese transport protein MntH [Lactiplantibacillus plantarum]KZU65219.1 Manganese transport protein MntH [Lactiplantibacillus plantarum]KZU65232.1 Manganese transport protein MntH [Lactiplantibacillus plantarum]OYL11804.1 hypothetical protein AXF33_15660 [Lactiplantibacillus plantarum]PHM02736.1 hypothetical protein EV52_14730 [Lactiplantibacillus plantarum]
MIFAIYYHGNEAKIEGLLTASQVFLSIALPFAIIPLVMFTSNKKLMGEFANHTWVKYAAWFATISAGNLEHLLDSPDGWLAEITV